MRICIFASHSENLCFCSLYLCIFALATRIENLCRAGLLRFYIFGISCNLLIVVFSVLFCFCNLYLCISVLVYLQSRSKACVIFCTFVFLFMCICICICVFVHSQNGSEACVIFCTFAFL